jgi:hypothetical protein
VGPLTLAAGRQSARTPNLSVQRLHESVTDSAAGRHSWAPNEAHRYRGFRVPPCHRCARSRKRVQRRAFHVGNRRECPRRELGWIQLGQLFGSGQHFGNGRLGRWHGRSGIRKLRNSQRRQRIGLACLRQQLGFRSRQRPAAALHAWPRPNMQRRTGHERAGGGLQSQRNMHLQFRIRQGPFGQVRAAVRRSCVLIGERLLLSSRSVLQSDSVLSCRRLGVPQDRNRLHGSSRLSAATD